MKRLTGKVLARTIRLRIGLLIGVLLEGTVPEGTTEDRGAIPRRVDVSPLLTVVIHKILQTALLHLRDIDKARGHS